MENTRTYSVKGILTALGKSLLYLLFFLAVQFLAGILYAAVASLLPRRGGCREHLGRNGDGGAAVLPADRSGGTAVVSAAAQTAGGAAGASPLLRLDGGLLRVLRCGSFSWWCSWRWRCCLRYG